MGSFEYDFYHVIKKERSDRRAAALNDFEAARQLASQAGMTLVQCSDVHYQLSLDKNGWLINVYPGNQRLYHDRNHPKPPFLDVSFGWGLIDVVKAAIKESNNTDTFEKEIANKARATMNQFFTQKRAYSLWEEAGRPIGDGKDFWHQAEKELRDQ